MVNRPLLSILIPTKNREEYVVKVVSNILSISDERLQVIIQNNSESDILKGMLSPFENDSRLSYFYCNEVLSFVRNFSLGIGNCTGEYVIIIGDDDSINPNILEIAEWAKKNSIEAITPTLPFVYYWPSSGVRSVVETGMLSITSFTCNGKYYNSKDQVIKYLKNGCLNYLSYNLAKVYHGLIKRSILEEIKLRTGDYVGGLSPDIYLSMATSLLVKKVLVIDYPLTISGICKKSGSSDSSTGNHTGDLMMAPHLRGHSTYAWSDRVPPFYSVETIWADSALVGVENMGMESITKFFQSDVLYAHCLKNYPQYKKLILTHMAKNYKIPASSIKMKFHRFKGLFLMKYNSFYIRLRNKISRSYTISRINDIGSITEASEVAKSIIRNSDSLIMEKLISL